MTSRSVAVRIRCGGRRGRCRLHLADAFVWASPDATGYPVDTSRVQRGRGFPGLSDVVPADLSGSVWFPTCTLHDQLYGSGDRPTQSGMNIQMPCHLLAGPLALFRRTGRTQDLLWTPTEQTAVVVEDRPWIPTAEKARRDAEDAPDAVRSEASTTQ